VSTELEAELRAAFQSAAEPAMPPADLAYRVRQAVRRKLAIGGIAAVAVLAAAAYLTTSLVTATSQSALSHPRDHDTIARVIVHATPSRQVDLLGVSGRYLYVATDNGGNPPYTLAAYKRATGRLIRQVSVPALPAALSIGPGNSVWLTFYPDQAGGPCGTWRLTADLSRRSAARNWCSPALLPTGPDTALTAGGNERLATVVLPPPGRPGQAKFEPYGGVGHYAVISLARLGTRVAALVTNDFGDYHVVIAGMRGLSFGGGSGPLVLSETAEANGLWVVAASNVTSAGPLVRLNDALRPVTPTAIKTNLILQQSQKVWSAGHTVWVATASPKLPLVCFTYGSVPGKVAAIPVRGPVAALVAEGRTVYVTVITPETDGNAADVFAYTVPPECR
jgi:hypothetical protein